MKQTFSSDELEDIKSILGTLAKVLARGLLHPNSVAP